MRWILSAALAIVLAVPASAQNIRPHKQIYIESYQAADDATDRMVKFQVSFGTELLSLPWFDIVGAYSQRSWWAIAEESAPFKEHNFNPEVFVQMDSLGPLRDTRGGVEHISTGVAGDSSAGLNMIFGQTTLSMEFAGYIVSVTPRLWWVASEDAGTIGIGDSDHTGLGIDGLGGTIRATVVTPLGQTVILEGGRRWGSVELLVDLIPGLNDYAIYFSLLRGQGVGALTEWDEYSTGGGVGLALTK